MPTLVLCDPLGWLPVIGTHKIPAYDFATLRVEIICAVSFAAWSVSHWIVELQCARMMLDDIVGVMCRHGNSYATSVLPEYHWQQRCWYSGWANAALQPEFATHDCAEIRRRHYSEPFQGQLTYKIPSRPHSVSVIATVLASVCHLWCTWVCALCQLSTFVFPRVLVTPLLEILLSLSMVVHNSVSNMTKGRNFVVLDNPPHK